MAKDVSRLKQIFQKTDGRCHICHGKLSFRNHGKIGAKGGLLFSNRFPSFSISASLRNTRNCSGVARFNVSSITDNCDNMVSMISFAFSKEVFMLTI